MNVYDFDGTIYDGDSTRDFIAFCTLRHLSVFARVPKAILALCKHALGKLSRDETKDECLRVLSKLPDLQVEVSAFWDTHMRKVMRWYIDQHKNDDLVISASPSFLVQEACHRLEIGSLIATEVDVHTMRMLTPNCRGSEKKKRLETEMPGIRIEAFYSDSKSDEPMARMAEQAYIVRRGKLLPWYIDRTC